MNFNEKIWEKCKLIPKGRVTTYKELANSIGSNAYRAVGMAMNKNPNGFLDENKKVPCHRVVASNGHLHGFAHGLLAKKLLESEGVRVENNKIADFEKVIFRF